MKYSLGRLTPGSQAETSSAVFRKNRAPLLDCMRGIAILAVLVYHVTTRYDYATLDQVAQLLGRYGGLGVDIFFPLSGFLITRYLLKATGPGAISRFFQRRFFRIVPLYMFAVTLFLVISLITGHEREIIDQIWINYLFLTGWAIFFEGSSAVPYTITWSLSVEEFAYILFGVVAWISHRNMLRFLLVLSLFALGLRFYLEFNHFLGVYNFPPARLDSIAIGGILAVMLGRGIRGVLPGFAIATVVTFGVAYSVPELWTTLKYSFITFGACTLIAMFETVFKDARVTWLSWLTSIGFYSYFTYLFHLFNIHILLELAAFLAPGWIPPFWGVVLATLAVTHFQAMLSFWIFEGPLMRYGRQLERQNVSLTDSSRSGQA